MSHSKGHKFIKNGEQNFYLIIKKFTQMKLTKYFLGFFLAFALTVAFNSQTQAQSTPKVKKRQVNQKKRIRNGVKSGELSKKEATKLRKQQRNIKKTKRAAKADGKVTRKERKQIQRKQNRASKNIKRKKHNNRKRKGN